ncbi:class I SAM-dependent methyltransferase, partial [Chloroflexota bacterium]
SEYMLLKDDRRLLLNELIDYVNEVLGDQDNAWILDLGGGDGWILRDNSSLPVKGVVVDLSKEQLLLGKRRTGGQDLNLIQADIDFLPFKPGVFQVIFASGVLHHFAPRHEAIIKILHHALANKGKLIVAEGWTIGPERTLCSNIFFYFPSFLLGVLAHAVIALHNPKSIPPLFFKGIQLILAKARLYKPKSDAGAITTGDARARIYPLYRKTLVKYLAKYFEVSPIRYYTWLAAFILQISVAVRNKKIRGFMLRTVFPLARMVDRIFTRSICRQYSHQYSITAVKGRS